MGRGARDTPSPRHRSSARTPGNKFLKRGIRAFLVIVPSGFSPLLIAGGFTSSITRPRGATPHSEQRKFSGISHLDHPSLQPGSTTTVPRALPVRHKSLLIAIRYPPGVTFVYSKIINCWWVVGGNTFTVGLE